MNLTLGKYIPRDSIIHNIDPRAKLISLILQITAVMLVPNLVFYLLPFTLLLILVVLSKIKSIVFLRSLKSIWFLIFFAAVIQYFERGILDVFFITFRLALIFLFASLLTFTTPPLMMARGIVDILKYFGVKEEAREDFGMMLSISIRFIPILLDETDRIIKAQLARGAKYQEKGLRNKLSAIISIVIPLLVSSLRKAEELSLALQARKYGLVKRTHYYTLQWKKFDTIYVLFNTVVMTLIIFFKFFSLS